MKMAIVSLLVMASMISDNISEVQGSKKKCTNPRGHDGESQTEGCLKQTCKNGVWRPSLEQDVCCYNDEAFPPNTTVTATTDGCSKASIECRSDGNKARMVLNVDSTSCLTVEQQLREVKQLLEEHMDTTDELACGCQKDSTLATTTATATTASDTTTATTTTTTTTTTASSAYGSLSGSSTGTSGSSSDGVLYSGWRLLENGTYIRVYDSHSGFGQTSSVSQSSSSQEVKLTGSSAGGSNQGSSAGGSNQGFSSLDVSGNAETGWVIQPDGTYIRKQSSRSSSSGGLEGQGTMSGRGTDDVVVTNGGKWVWSVVNDKWEWEAAPTIASASAGGNSGNVVDSG